MNFQRSPLLLIKLILFSGHSDVAKHTTVPDNEAQEGISK